MHSVPAVVTETVDHGFDWGSAAVGAGSGAGLALLVIAVATSLRSIRRAGTNHQMEEDQ